VHDAQVVATVEIENKMDMHINDTVKLGLLCVMGSDCMTANNYNE
jgi:hypothetical protein